MKKNWLVYMVMSVLVCGCASTLYAEEAAEGMAETEMSMPAADETPHMEMNNMEPGAPGTVPEVMKKEMPEKKAPARKSCSGRITAINAETNEIVIQNKNTTTTVTASPEEIAKYTVGDRVQVMLVPGTLQAKSIKKMAPPKKGTQPKKTGTRKKAPMKTMAQ